MEPALNVIKIFTLGTISFLFAFFLTPPLTHFLYKRKLWKKEVRTKAIDGGELPVFQKFHKEGETNVPRFGGILIWLTTFILIFLFYLLPKILHFPFIEKLNFLSRDQTWLPLFALISASLLGLADDILQVLNKGKYVGGGMKLRTRIIIMALIGLLGGLWFYFKLQFSSIHVPGIGDIPIDGLYIPLFVFVMIAVYSGGVIDGIDGLAGGSFAAMFAAFAGIALYQNQINIAAFSSVILGALLAFLWFNIPPARFYMGETGMMGLCATLTVLSFLTDSVLVLPIIAFLLVVESLSAIIQIISKRFFKKKVFLAAPIHHHFEAKGWPSYKITMRFWVVGVVMAIIGIAIRLLG